MTRYTPFAAALALALAAGCALHHGLDLATDYADPLYAAAVVECDASERWVIAHHEPEEVDAADAALSRVRRRCDAIFAAFEEARSLQGVLRATADALEDGRATISDLTRSVDDVLALARSTRSLVDALRLARARGEL